MGLSENVVYSEKPNGFADHYPVSKWLFFGGIPHFQTYPLVSLITPFGKPPPSPLPPLPEESLSCVGQLLRAFTGRSVVLWQVGTGWNRLEGGTTLTFFTEKIWVNSITSSRRERTLEIIVRIWEISPKWPQDSG